MSTIDISVSLVRRLVQAQFPDWAALPITPVEPGGWDNRTFRLGDELSARLPSAERYVAQVDKEQRWLPQLAPKLPLPIPVPVARGAPSSGYPWPWSIHRWLEGETASVARVGDEDAFAASLAGFLSSLHQIEPADGPLPGPHNFFRGAPLAVYDAETRTAMTALRGRIDITAVKEVWETALETTWTNPPVWGTAT